MSTLYDKHLEAIMEAMDRAGNYGNAALAVKQITLDEIEKILHWIQDNGEEGSKIDRWYNNKYLTADLIKTYYERSDI